MFDANFTQGVVVFQAAQDFVAGRDATWTGREMQLAVTRFAEVFGHPAKTWGAAGWQTNAHAARFEERYVRQLTAATTRWHC